MDGMLRPIEGKRSKPLILEKIHFLWMSHKLNQKVRKLPHYYRTKIYHKQTTTNHTNRAEA